jgi:hypothetical protein
MNRLELETRLAVRYLRRASGTPQQEASVKKAVQFCKGGKNSEAVKSIVSFFAPFVPDEVTSTSLKEPVAQLYLFYNLGQGPMNEREWLRLPPEFKALGAELMVNPSYPEQGEVYKDALLDRVVYMVTTSPNSYYKTVSITVCYPGAASGFRIKTAPEGTATLLAPSGGALSDGVIWQFNPDKGKSPQGGVLQLKALAPVGGAKLRLPSEGVAIAVLEACLSQGSRSSSILSLAGRLGAKDEYRENPILNVPGAVRAYKNLEAEVGPLFQNFARLVYEAAGVPGVPAAAPPYEQVLLGTGFRLPNAISPIRAPYLLFKDLVGIANLSVYNTPLSNKADVLSFIKRVAAALPESAKQAARQALQFTPQ